MNDNKTTEQKPKAKEKEDKKRVNPGEIIGKIAVHDTRERRDGPGGN